MIDPAKLSERDVGRAVVYTPPAGEPERGVISSWNDEFVFVRYGAETIGKASPPEWLEFEWPQTQHGPRQS